MACLSVTFDWGFNALMGFVILFGGMVVPMLVKYKKKKIKLSKNYILTNDIILSWKNINTIYLFKNSEKDKFQRNIRYSLRISSNSKTSNIEISDLNYSEQEIIDLVVSYWSYS
jgi:hypothetical protein